MAKEYVQSISSSYPAISGVPYKPGVKITTEELKVVAESLKKQRDTLNDIYKTQIQKVLEQSSSCFSVAGLDTTSINSSFEQTFKGINTNLTTLIDLLENKVIKSYSELSYAIQQMFTADFGAKLNEILNRQWGYIESDASSSVRN